MIPSERLDRGGIVWRLSARGRELLSPEMLDPATLAGEEAQTIKDGGHRSVIRVRRSGVDVYWKIARFLGPRGWLRDLVRGAKSGIEFRKLELLQARGIATIQPLAWGKHPGPWPKGSFLITESLPEAVTLGDYLTGRSFSVAERREVAIKLARFLSALHDAGLAHTDMHPGNILLDAGKPGEPWRLIDVHDLFVARGPLSSRQRIRNLVMLNRWFGLRTTRTDRAAFWREYSSGGRIPKAIATRIESATLDSNRELWRSRDQRCLGENRDYERREFNGQRGHARKGLSPAALKLFEDPEKALKAPDTRLLKDSRTSTVAVVRADGAEYLLKRFNIKRWHTPLANLFRPSPALRSWIGAGALENRSLPTPRTLSVCHRHRWFLPCEGYLLTEFLPEAIALDEAPDVEGPRWLDETAMMLRRMHELGLAHRDLKASNIVISRGELYLIDLVGLERRRTVSRAVRFRDLARLNVSSSRMPWVRQTDRLRWLKRYLSANLAELADWKVWWKEIRQRSMEKLGKNERSGRPIN